MTMTRSLDAWLRDFVAEGTQPEVVARFVDTVGSGIADSAAFLSADPVLADEVRTSIRAHWLLFLQTVATADDQHFVLPAQAGVLAQTIAHRGMEVTALLKIYRAAYQGVFAYITDVSNALRPDDPSPHDVVTFLWTRGERWLDAAIDRLIEVYYDERSAITESTRQRNRQLIERLLATDDATGLDAAADTLHHGLHQWQTGGIAWNGGSERDALALARAAADRVAAAVGAPAPLTTSVGVRDLWFWVATPQRPDLQAVDDALADLGAQDSHVALGSAAPGITGFRGSHKQEQRVARLVMSAPVTPVLTRYADVELLCLLDGPSDAVTAMVAREIGPLCGADKNLAALRETVLAYLRDRSIETVAAALFVHKNTVRYRLTKAEELLGHPLTERSTEVDVALRHVQLFGSPSVRADCV